jgi:predicted CXXCH cytochrome family protein
VASPARILAGKRASVLAAATFTALTFGLAAVAVAQEKPCAECHAKVELSATPHAELECLDCHDNFDAVPHAAALPAEPYEVCSDCHRKISKKLAASVHRVGGKAAPDCSDCHGSGHAIRLAQDAASPASPAQLQATCAQCHKIAAKSAARGVHAVDRGGRPVATCVDCHQQPHEIAKASTALAACSTCHAGEATEQHASLHGRAEARGDKLAPTCVTCHGGHGILSHKDAKSPVAAPNVPLLCGRCHREGAEVSLSRDIPQERILENYADSIHGEGLFKKGLTVTAVCTSCHTAHSILPHTDAKSSINQRNVAGTCSQCHGRIEEVHRKVIEGHLWESEPHKIPACVDCHEPHKVRRVYYSTGMANQDCQSCHAKPDIAMQRDGKRVSLFVDPVAYAASRHAQTACAQCHTEVAPSHTRPCETITRKADCGVCHAQQVEQYNISTHGTLAAAGDPDAPGCVDCHSAHATESRNEPLSPTFARNVPELCARCHRLGEKAAVRIHGKTPDIVGSYADSIHGRGLTDSGLVVTATCVNCHSSHGELPPEDPRSSVNRANLADTCGKCHFGVKEAFATSIHATGKPREGEQLPICEDCHSSHDISRLDVAGARTRMLAQCGDCHKEQAETFFQTFHGKVSHLGGEAAAKCSDCHGKHNVLSPDNPASTLSRDNVVETCAQCHAGSNRRFAGYLTHATHHDRDKYPWLYWSFRFMTALLVGTLSFAILHTLAWLIRLFLSRDQWRHVKAASRVEGQTRLYHRFSAFQRMQHLMMMVSFFALAITGMALKFSYAGWAQDFSRAFGGFHTMGVVHRLGALVLIMVFCLHLWDVRSKKIQSGQTWRQMLTGSTSILFTPRDWKEFVGSIKWFTGLGPRPNYGRYTYWEKFDYFAVFWGVMVIGLSGFALWFPEMLTQVMPGWTINVATIIHSDEALLAVGFIFTIHFFNTHFRPDKFPMDPVIFTGRVPIEELKHDKPAEYAQLVERGELEAHMVGPIAKPVERALRIFGFTALAIGLTLIGLIVYAMLFGYR